MRAFQSAHAREGGVEGQPAGIAGVHTERHRRDDALGELPAQPPRREGPYRFLCGAPPRDHGLEQHARQARGAQQPGAGDAQGMRHDLAQDPAMKHEPASCGRVRLDDVVPHAGRVDQRIQLGTPVEKGGWSGLEQPVVVMDAACLPADVRLALQHEHVEIRPVLSCRPGARQSRNAGADHDEPRGHTVWLKTGLAAAACFSCW